MLKKNRYPLDRSIGQARATALITIFSHLYSTLAPYRRVTLRVGKSVAREAAAARHVESPAAVQKSQAE